MIVRIVAGAPKAFTNFDEGYVIAVDKGVKHCLEQNIKIDLAIGDFDSYDESKVRVPMIKLNPVKDETDIFVAIQEAIKLSPKKIFIYGGTNGRFDHYLANINLLDLYDIELVDEMNRIFVKSESFSIDSKEYISFFRFKGNPVITLEGFKYPLTNYLLLDKDNLCVSNETVGKGYVNIEQGSVLVVISKKD